MSRLTSFVKNECANYDNGDCCHQDKSCVVLADEPKPCAFFEQAVLGPADYPYKDPKYDYPKMYEQYGQINEKYLCAAPTVIRCQCGEVLPKGRRLCDKCKRLKRQQTYRERRQKQKG